MPIAKLYVEGALEVQVLVPILLGNPVPQMGGAKNTLKARAGTERRENKVAAGYLRDRDFDFDPPDDQTKPTLDSMFQDKGVPLGWRWCRHETENYLVDPAIVSEAMGWPRTEYEEALRQAAKKIRSYEVARWTIGSVRRVLPPHYALETRPEGLSDIGLPLAIDSVAVNAWAIESIAKHRAPMAAATDPAAVQSTFDAFAARFNDDFVSDVGMILIWFSGKDLLAGLTDWLVTQEISNAGAFRGSMRDWIIANPVQALQFLPEWNGLIEVLRT